MSKRVNRRLSSKNYRLAELFTRVREIILDARKRAWRKVNVEMVGAYWKVGREIVEEEQQGQARAEYGERVIEHLSAGLSRDIGPGYSKNNLWYMRQFYLTFTPSLLKKRLQKLHVLRGESERSPSKDKILHALRGELSWTHYRMLLSVENPQARDFYETEACKANWATRDLERQIASHFYERLLMSRDKKGMRRLALKGHEPKSPQELLKDPYVLEFTGLPEEKHLYESDLETALIEKMKNFLLELGRGFSFVARQKRITLDGDHHWIDLVFYHIPLKRYVLIDLKARKLAHEDIGQMQMYVHYFDRKIREPGMAETIGILLCARKNNAVVKFTLPEENRQIFASKYKLYLPTAAELAAELRQEKETLEREKRLRKSIALLEDGRKTKRRV